MIEEFAGLPTEVDNASEFRYRNPVIGPRSLVVTVTQSGETADTLSAMDEARQRRAPVIVITNTVGSQATRLADGIFLTHCGIEICVAASKTLAGQLTALYLLAVYLGRQRGSLASDRLQSALEDLARAPNLVASILPRLNDQCEALARRYFRYRNFLYLGRGVQYPMALEGALKLKEISYIHAEGYPAGEMKHGPIALVDENLPVLAIALRDRTYEKMVSNIQQVKARSAKVIAVTDEGNHELDDEVDEVLKVPMVNDLLNPLLTLIPMQLLAYHIAVSLGCDVDQPRNLAKTVTVE
jgi:glucosamine--fructose-6-phosphate aminotransferase (isomerizing)